MMRCFLGFELTADARAYLAGVLEPLHRTLAERHGWPVRLVHPDNWHATLLFFPGLSAEERTEVWRTVEPLARNGRWRALDFAWRGLALWPSPKRPNLVCVEAPPYGPARDWLSAEMLGREPLAKGDVDKLATYRPHITVMRFRRERRRQPYAHEWQALQPELPALDPARITFDRLSFLLSTTTPEAPVYQREHTVPLA